MGVGDRERDQERSSIRDSNSGCPQCNGAICWRAAHKAIGANGLNISSTFLETVQKLHFQKFQKILESLQNVMGKMLSFSKVNVCVLPDKAAENVEAAVLSAVQVHAEDGRKDEQHHSEVKHHNHCGLREKMKMLSTYSHSHKIITHSDTAHLQRVYLCQNHNDPNKFNFR